MGRDRRAHDREPGASRNGIRAVVAVASTNGNPDGHVILRGGKTPNYDARSVEAACRLLDEAGLPMRLMIDASHANSGKLPHNQPQVIENVAAQNRGR